MATLNLKDGQSLADPALLDKIDKSFACNVGEYINLPQLVVVGDQSSGKSSVLEGLTKLAFPRDSGLCTRFATQIIFRRVENVQRSIKASIIPGPTVENARAVQLRDWKMEDLQTLSVDRFSRMMSEVHAHMGLSTSKEDGLPTFSDSVLRLEICGPDEDHLSVIDVPGIFRTTTMGVTTPKDITMVREMVLRYMQNPRSIMLAVVPANVDIVTQEIIELAQEVDPEGERTLGVLTKPDLVDPGAESKLGWIVVRNLGQKEVQEQNVDRDGAEAKLLQVSPWNNLGKDRFGIEALKSRLQETVTANARRAFPSVRAEISRKLRTCQDQLEALGGERETSEQQIRYLLNVMNLFNDITRQALGTNYSSYDQFEKDDQLRFATRIVNRNESFSKKIAQWGHKYHFGIKEGGNSDTEAPIANFKNKERPKTGNVLRTRELDDLPDLEDIVLEPGDGEVCEPLSSDIYIWIERQYRRSRGFEIGTFNPTLLSTIMKQQSDKWTSISHGYISDVITMVHQFILKVLGLACPDTRVCQNLLSILMDKLLERYKQSIDKVRFLLDVERSGTPMTQNHYLNDTLRKCQQQRSMSRITQKIFEDSEHEKFVRVSDITDKTHLSNETHAVQTIHDILESYYKVARKRFVDNVCMQAVDYHLVTGPETPMRLFSSSFVGHLTTEQLEEIAGEEAVLKRKRRRLKKEVADLKIAKKILF
ncbi:P-loop containing nucleoside triphosphate hydrolase protein [Talaromyces proteolyticus]|uniref:P-loop containing nucleoside triphosphate hydrolase protein n=1 Tax=Talaromyces proteolyticus TaxID=1131652 RepID=A0AAD4KF73_9EURO|nr:P-loop containing nucleoside triphosphate hydrolase protein [Talaromyces proteolyticus]KAH8690854.1 P-loop containing nucleoside triphosphate hydrolase protein [Talaromyces proteolyticus]